MLSDLESACNTVRRCLNIKRFSAFAKILLQSFSHLLQTGEYRGELFREANWCLFRLFTTVILSVFIARQGNPNPSHLPPCPPECLTPRPSVLKKLHGSPSSILSPSNLSLNLFQKKEIQKKRDRLLDTWLKSTCFYGFCRF